jgi:hypothetical protein
MASKKRLVVQDEVDSLVVPVVRSYEDRQTQTRLDTFVTMTHRFAKIRSKRLQRAVAAVSGMPLGDEMVLGISDNVTRQGSATQKGFGVIPTQDRSRKSGVVTNDSDVSTAPAGFSDVSRVSSSSVRVPSGTRQRKRRLDISEQAIRDAQGTRAAEVQARRFRQLSADDDSDEGDACMEGEIVDVGLAEFLH